MVATATAWAKNTKSAIRRKSMYQAGRERANGTLMKEGHWRKPTCKDQRGGWSSGHTPRWTATPRPKPPLSPRSLHAPLRHHHRPVLCVGLWGRQAEDQPQRWSLEGRVLLSHHQSQPPAHGCACGLAWPTVDFLLNRLKEWVALLPR